MDENKPSLAYVDPDYDSYSRGFIAQLSFVILNNDEKTLLFSMNQIHTFSPFMDLIV